MSEVNISTPQQSVTVSTRRQTVSVQSASSSGGTGVPGPPGPKGDKGDKGDSVTAGAGEPSTIIPGVSTYIDAVSGEVYVYEEE